MAPLLKTLLLAFSATSSLAQTQDRITWGSVVFTFHGEKIPTLSRGSHNLTPLGAQQLLNAGEAIRARYISENATITTDFFPINGMPSDNIDNTQMDIMALDDEYQTASALAFMQGLYPPRRTQVYDDESLYAPGTPSSNGLGTLIQYPLDGYQYPNIETVSELDLSYIWIAGHIGCDNYSISEVKHKNTSAYRNRINSTLPFYRSLRSSVFSEFTSPSILDFRYASQLYEYALYEYLHNRTIYNSDDFTADDLATLYNLASEQQFAINSPNSEGTVSSIAGQTLTSKVLQQFKHISGSNGYADKLTLMFTSFEPFLSFFALSGLAVGPSGSKFKSLPLHGSVMAFELFSYPDPDISQNLTQPFPQTTDLFVRFLFRNGTGSRSQLVAYPLFGRSPSQTDMSWSDFVDGMDDFSMDDVSEWCNVCETTNLFCAAIEANMNSDSGSESGSSSLSGSTNNNRLSPAVYGVIGAAVTLAVAILAAVVLGLFGFRLEHYERNKKAGGVSDLGVLRTVSGNGNGGFKGAEKLASDTDLRLKGGAGATVVRHERVGSWELNDSPRSPHSSLDKDVESGRAVSQTNYGRRSEDDGIERVNPFGDPVKAADQV